MPCFYFNTLYNNGQLVFFIPDITHTCITGLRITEVLKNMIYLQSDLNSDTLSMLLFFFSYQLDVLFGNLTEMVAFQVEFLKTLEDGVRLVPDLEKLEKVEQFKVIIIYIQSRLTF